MTHYGEWRFVYFNQISDCAASMKAYMRKDAARVRGALDPALLAPIADIVVDYRGVDGRVVWAAAGNFTYYSPEIEVKRRWFRESLFVIYVMLRGIRGCAADESLYDHALRHGLANHLRHAYNDADHATMRMLEGGEIRPPSRIDISRVFAEAVALGRDDVVNVILAAAGRGKAVEHYHDDFDLIEGLLMTPMDEKKKIDAIRATASRVGMTICFSVCMRTLSPADAFVLAMAFRDAFADDHNERLRQIFLYTLGHGCRDIPEAAAAVIESSVARSLPRPVVLECFVCGVEAAAAPAPV